MFWIHGGGNTSGLKDIYDFSKMVRKHNVIVVTINYQIRSFWLVYTPFYSRFTRMVMINLQILEH
jgi:para-nitrobenzyl esterase